MIGIDREAVLTHHRMVANEFDLTFQLVVAWGAKPLPVGPIKEEIEVTFMSDHMVYDGGW